MQGCYSALGDVFQVSKLDFFPFPGVDFPGFNLVFFLTFLLFPTFFPIFREERWKRYIFRFYFVEKIVFSVPHFICKNPEIESIFFQFIEKLQFVAYT